MRSIPIPHPTDHQAIPLCWHGAPVVARTACQYVILGALFSLLQAFSGSIGLADDSVVEGPEPHVFTNKEGQQIEAHLVAVGGSLSTIIIERPGDVRRFEIEILSLSLDDQQYLKDWLHAQPAPEPDTLSLRIEAQPVFSDVVRERFEDRVYGGSGTRSKVGYEFAINSLERLPLLDCRLEYVVLVEDRLQIRAFEPGDVETIRWRFRKTGPVVYQSGSIDLGPLKYNTEQLAVSKTLSHEEVRGASSYTDAEDSVVGVLARLVSADGSELAQFSDIDRNFDHLTWETVARLRDATDSIDGQGILSESLVTR